MNYQLGDNKNILTELKNLILKEKLILKELKPLFSNLENTEDKEEKDMVFSQINSLKNNFNKVNGSILSILEKMSVRNELPSQEPLKKILEKPQEQEKKISIKIENPKKSEEKKEIRKEKIMITGLEKEILKRLKKKEKEVVEKKIKKPSKYIKIANKIFSKTAKSLENKEIFKTLENDLVKANMQFIPQSYIAVILFTSLLSIFASLFVFIFFLFFNIGPELPIITPITENIITRFMKVFWILFVVPIGTFLSVYFYPSMERKSREYRIDQELPFATIHMSAISGSMIDPSKIFTIIISTKEYPYLEKEFTKLINEINILGYDLVTALRNSATNSSSKKLTDLFNGLATTINSGGNLPSFFEKRSQSLLFDYKLEREKYTRSTETFMDIYISVVIAAPMILMLLLMMMKISGLGISLSTSMITLVMVLGISVVNAIFLTFLHLKQPAG